MFTESPPLVHIVGRKNSGKTTLVVALVEELSTRGLSIGTIKHTHHHHELDTPGKDSYLHKEAGAVGVAIISPAMDALFLPRVDPGEDSTMRIRAMAQLLSGCDLVIVEGGQHCDGKKVEIWRPLVDAAPLADTDSSICALISDDQPPASSAERPLWPRNDITTLADNLLALANA